MSRGYLLGVTDARTYFAREGVTIAAFVAPDGRHVLLELDTRLDQVGLIDPTNNRAWVFAKRVHDCWPLRPLGDHETVRCPGCDTDPIGYAPHNGKGDCPPIFTIQGGHDV